MNLHCPKFRKVTTDQQTPKRWKSSSKSEASFEGLTLSEDADSEGSGGKTGNFQPFGRRVKLAIEKSENIQRRSKQVFL